MEQKKTARPSRPTIMSDLINRLLVLAANMLPTSIKLCGGSMSHGVFDNAAFCTAY